MWKVIKEDELYHHGIKGQKWGVRRFQKLDGTLTELGKKLKKKAGVPEDIKAQATKQTTTQVAKKAAKAAGISMAASAALIGGLEVARASKDPYVRERVSDWVENGKDFVSYMKEAAQGVADWVYVSVPW